MSRGGAQPRRWLWRLVRLLVQELSRAFQILQVLVGHKLHIVCTYEKVGDRSASFRVGCITEISEKRIHLGSEAIEIPTLTIRSSDDVTDKRQSHDNYGRREDLRFLLR